MKAKDFYNNMAQEINSDPAFIDGIRIIEKNYLLSQLGEDVDTTFNIVPMVRYADLLSRSTRAEDRNKALYIMGLLRYKDNGSFYKEVAKEMFIRFGNFASLKLLGDVESYQTLNSQFAETFKKEFHKSQTHNFILTDAQVKLLSELEKNNHYSFSGPTSFGKTFLIMEYLKREIKRRNFIGNFCILVPTRALIGEISNKLFNEIENTSEFQNRYKVLSQPEIPAYYKKGKTNFIFVFTPERLISYLYTRGTLPIDELFIDEAQKLVAESDERSALYYQAIMLADSRSTRLFFSSPYVSNSDVFLKLFKKDTESSISIKESPVSQFLAWIDLDEKNIQVDNNIWEDKSLPETVFDLIKKIGSNESNLIYANSKQKTIDMARNLAASSEKTINQQLLAAAKIISEYIHEDYYLVELLKRGIGFHFGGLPQKVRRIIEKLFRDGELKYLVTTSTLLEGVNLPAKNLFVLSNRIGKRKLTALNFKNLTGRAGRLGNDLIGNIFVVKSQDETQWSGVDELEKISNVKELNIQSPIDTGSKNFYENIGRSLNKQPFTRKSISFSEKKTISTFANITNISFQLNVSSKLLDTFMRTKNKQIKILTKLEKENNIPIDILAQSPSVKADYQNEFFDNGVKLDELTNLLIGKPSYEQCLKILNLLSEIYNWKEEESGGGNPLFQKINVEGRMKYLAVLMNDWVNTEPLNKIIASSLAYFSGKRIQTANFEIEPFDVSNQAHVNIIINRLISDIDTQLRFKIKGYLVNAIQIILANNSSSENAISFWEDYLEYGTTNQGIIQLQKLGLSRRVAKILMANFSNYIRIDDNELEQLDSAFFTNIINSNENKYLDKDDLKELSIFLKSIEV